MTQCASSPTVVFIGSPTADTVIRNGNSHPIIGGAAFISALASRWAGAQTGVVARVPSRLPDKASAVFGPHGLHRGGLTYDDGELPRFRIEYDDDDRATYSRIQMGMEETLCAEDIPRHWMTPTTRWIHIAGIGASAAQQLRLLKRLRTRFPDWEGTLSVGTCRAMIEADLTSTQELLNQADVFFLNEEEFRMLCPNGPPSNGPVMVVTQGADGVEVMGGPHAGQYPAITAEVVDPTGAGDSLCGGFIGASVTGHRDPVRTGIQAAATVLKGFGAAPLSSWVASQVGRRADHDQTRTDVIAPRVSQAGQSAAFSFSDPPHLEAGHPMALSMLVISTLHQYGFWLSDPIQGWQKPMYAELDGHRYKGSDFIWAAFARTARESPDLLSIERMAEDKTVFKTICTADDGHCPVPDIESHQSLHMEHAFAMKQLWPGGYSELLSHVNRSDRPVSVLLESLKQLPGYMSDPLAKKANLLAVILSARPERFLKMKDPESVAPIVDYHMMRVCLRTGLVRISDPDLRRRLAERTWVDPREEYSIREATGRAIERLVQRTGRTVAEIDGLFFKIGRTLCLETEPTRCTECPLQAVCAQDADLFQPIFRTTAY